MPVLAALAVLSGCATTRPFVRPAGPASPVADHAALWQSATATCRSERALLGELRLSGRVAGERIPSVTLPFAVDAGGRLGFQAQGLFSSEFRFGGTTAEATLYLRGDNRVVRGPAGEIVEALIGVRLEPPRLLALVSGCITTSSESTAAEHFGSVVRVTTADATVFLVEEAGAWRPRAGVFERLNVDYRRVELGRPREIRITSEPDRSPSVDVTIAVRSLDINPVFTGAEFNVNVPADAIPASLEELRAAGPLGKAP